MTEQLSAHLKEEIDFWVEKYPPDQKRSAVLGALRAAQHENHGFLTVDGQKMSKSRGTFINARNYLDHLNPEYLRYYFAAKLSSRIDDLDLNLEDFALRVNADLVGKVVNIASRCAGFISKRFDNTLATQQAHGDLYQ